MNSIPSASLPTAHPRIPATNTATSLPPNAATALGPVRALRRHCAVALGVTACAQTFAGPAGAQEAYKRPPQEVVAIVDASPPPIVLVSPTRTALLRVEYDAYPSIALLSRPFLKLGGLRVDPALNAIQRLRQYRSIAIQPLPDGATRRVALPAGAAIQVPVWSNDGRRFAFARDLDDGLELWVADASTGEAHAIGGLRLNDVLGTPFDWTGDNQHLLVCLVPDGRGAAPAAAAVPLGPDVQETSGKRSRMATYRDLLTDAHDEELFAYYGASQLAVVDVASGSVQPVGKPGLILEADFSPDGRYLLVTRLERPFSFRVPYYFFTRSIEVWDARGEPVATVARLPVSDEVPQQGVPTGARDVDWQPLQPATLVWAEALDGGDPLAKVPHRDRLMRVAVADAERGGKDAEHGGNAGVLPDVAAGARPVLQLAQRFARIQWTGRADQ